MTKRELTRKVERKISATLNMGTVGGVSVSSGMIIEGAEDMDHYQGNTVITVPVNGDPNIRAIVSVLGVD